MSVGDERLKATTEGSTRLGYTGWNGEFLYVYYESRKRELKIRLMNEGRCDGILVYYESIKRKLNKRLILDCRCDGRLKGKVEGSTRVEDLWVVYFLFIL